MLGRWSFLWVAGVGLGVWGLGVGATAAVVPDGGVPPGAAEFPMVEVSLIGPNLWMSQVTPYLSPRREPGVKAYPKFTSTTPAYGRVIFDPDPLRDTELTYYFVLDESRGTGSGYDRFCLDANYDGDLTNDPVFQPTGRPVQLRGDIGRMFFGPILVDFNYPGGSGVFRQQVLALLTGSSHGISVSFAVPVIHQGRIALGGRFLDASLMQVPTVTGRFDRPGTTLCLNNGMWEPLCRLRRVDGTLYAFSATAYGDRLYASAYTGAWGLLQNGIGDRHAVRIEEGMVRSNKAILDLNDFKCPGGWRIPVGDYRPYRRIMARVGAARVTLGPYRDPCDVDGPSRTPVFFMKVRPDCPCALALDTRPEIRFETPCPTERVKTGQELRLAAIVYDPAKDLQVFNLEDTLRTETIRQPGMKPYKRLVGLDPTVVITDSSKTVVAQGKMPFG